MSKGRTSGEFGSQRHRGGEQFLRWAQSIEKAPALRLFAGHAAAGEEQLGSTSLPDDSGQHGARSHITTGKPYAGEEKGDLAARGAQAKIRGHGKDRAGSGANAVNGGDDGLRTGAHSFHHIAAHTGESEQAGHIKLCERADDLVHIATRAKI